VVPDRNFITAGQTAGVNCSGSTIISTEVGNIPCNMPVTGVGNFSISLPRNGEQWTARVDHSFNNSKDRLYGSANRTTTERVLFNTPFVYPAFNNIEPTSASISTRTGLISSPRKECRGWRTCARNIHVSGRLQTGKGGFQPQRRGITGSGPLSFGSPMIRSILRWGTEMYTTVSCS